MSDDMAWPARCRHCLHVHDAAKVEVVQWYTDCSVWRCPNCTALIDDRPVSFGGSATGPDVLKRRTVTSWGDPA